MIGQMSQVLDPSKELRFTRGAQAVLFFVLAGLFLVVGVTLFLIAADVHATTGNLEELPYPLWLLYLPWLPFAGCLFLSFYCARHPYLLLSPMGVEVFPFWRPVKNFQLVEWGRIAIVEFKETQMVLHHTAEKKSGVVLTLSPLHKKSRLLLQKAMEGVMEQRNSKS